MNRHEPIEVFIWDPLPRTGELDWVIGYVSQDGVNVSFTRTMDSSDRAELLSRAHVVIVVASAVGAADLMGLPNLRSVVSLSPRAAVDPAVTTTLGIRIVTLPSDTFSTAVAEHTVALILAVAKRLSGDPRAAAQNRLGYSPVATGASVYRYNWAGWSPVSVRDSRLGLVGFGRIGRRVASIAVALGMKVSYCCRHRLTPGDEAKSCVQYKSLPDLCAESDFISLHVPYSEETRGIIGSREFSLMRPGAVLINTSRGGVVDEAELVRALQSGRLGGAALDVFSVEPVPEDHRLLRLENVLITPHVAAGVLDMRQLAK